MKMIKSTEEYLDQLKAELKGGDTATIQDALSDAEEHLRAALTSLKQDQPELPEEEALGQVVEQYGSPSETASAYMEVERRTVPQLGRERQNTESAIIRFFGVYTRPRMGRIAVYVDRIRDWHFLLHLGCDRFFAFCIVCIVYLWPAVCVAVLPLCARAGAAGRSAR
jgi:hypothetical protein